MSIFLIFLDIVISFSQRFFWKSLHGHMERWLPGKTSDLSLVMYAGFFNHLVCLNPSIGYNIAFIFECNAYLSRIQEKNCCYFRFIASFLHSNMCAWSLASVVPKASDTYLSRLYTYIGFVSASVTSTILRYVVGSCLQAWVKKSLLRYSGSYSRCWEMM